MNVIIAIIAASITAHVVKTKSMESDLHPDSFESIMLQAMELQRLLTHKGDRVEINVLEDEEGKFLYIQGEKDLSLNVAMDIFC